MSDELDLLLRESIIEHRDISPWISSIVVTTRKEGRRKLCVDLREPNITTAADSQPLPYVDWVLCCLKEMMKTVLKGLPGVHNYLDGVIVAGSSLQEYGGCLCAVLQHLTYGCLTLNMHKCLFCQSSLRFLGHMISKDDILPATDHSAATTTWSCISVFLSGVNLLVQ